MNLTKDQLKRIMVNYHFLNTKNKPHTINEVFDRLKTIQFDPLNVVGRNSDLVLQSRIKNYKPKMLEDALYKDRILLDGWDKQMCIYQSSYYSHFKRVRDDRAESEVFIYNRRLDIDVLNFIDDVTELLKEKGPLYSTEIKLGETKKTTWGSSKPSNAALSYLFHRGDIGINKRRNTQKQFELIENLIDLSDNCNFTDEEFSKWYVLRRLKTMGVLRNKNNIALQGIEISDKKVRTKYLNELVEDGLAYKVEVDGIKDDLYLLKEAYDLEDNVQKKVSFIAPLDNFIWDRDLILMLFDFDYKWEVYTPKAKRRWGYYVLPILYGHNLVGRIEFEQQRKQDPLVIKEFYLENNVKSTKKLKEDIHKGLKNFMKYLGSNELVNFNKINEYES